MSSIVERLREDARGGMAYHELSDEAADEIERLRAELDATVATAKDYQGQVERLKAENAKLREWKALDKPLTAAMGIATGEIEKMKAEIAQWRLENGRMRAACLRFESAQLRCQENLVQAIDDNNRLRALNAMLLEALGAIANHEVAQRYDVATTAQKIAEAAIAKAEGESPSNKEK